MFLLTEICLLYINVYVSLIGKERNNLQLEKKRKVFQISTAIFTRFSQNLPEQSSMFLLLIFLSIKSWATAYCDKTNELKIDEVIQ